MSLSPRDASFLLRCLRYIGAEAPCQARIDEVIASVAGSDAWQDCRVPPTVFARALSMASVIWAIDSGLVDVDERDLAQRVLEVLWAMGPIRPELIGSQLRCLVGQDGGERHCRWTCPAMRRANAGFTLDAGARARPALPDLAWAVVEASIADGEAAGPPAGHYWTPRRGSRIRCRACGRLGTVLGVDPDDGWTVVEHHPPVLQRPDGLWEVQPAADGGPRQCRYLAHPDEARVG